MGGDFNSIMGGLSVDSLWTAMKWAYVLALSIYTAFSLVVLAQVKQMIASFRGQLDGVIKMVAWIHVMVAVGALFLGIVIL